MAPIMKNFVAVLLGVIIYKAINFALDSGDIDFAAEALEAVAIAAIATVVLLAINRWRNRGRSVVS